MADAVPKETISSDINNANPSKFFSQFLYKAAFVTLFLVLLPLFPSLAPDFINQTLHARSWELLQLIFVGIAVSYGLFSKKNDDKDKDHTTNAQSYVSKLLQVSSVFDDESENQTVIEESKFQALNSQYSRGQPIVAKETPVVEDESGVVSRISQKPLLLPVRSLKQRVPSPNLEDCVPSPNSDDLSESAGRNVPRSGSRRFSNSNSRKFRNIGGLNVEKLVETEEENVVLRSPIPWRSRSGRMEIGENGDDIPRVAGSGSISLIEEEEFNRLEKPRSFNSPGANSSPKKLSTKAESEAKISEDSVRKKRFSSPPPPPPPPPPHFLRKSVLTKSNSSVAKNGDSPEKVFRRSVRSVPEAELPRRTNSGFGSEIPGRIQNDGSLKSVRTFGTTAEKESDDEETMKDEILEKVLMESTDDENSEAEEEDDQFEAVNDVGPDVDKKADEFIAKFREQIRLQRIESIRKTTAQRAGKSLR